MNKKTVALLVCPLCKGKLQLDNDSNELICRADRLAFPIQDGMPVMLESQARELSQEELAK